MSRIAMVAAKEFDAAPDGSSGSPWEGWADGASAGSATEADVVVVPRPRAAAGLDDESLVAALVAAEAVGRRVDAWRVTLAAKAAQRSRRELGADGLARRLGCRTGVELVQRTTGVAGATASRRIRLGAAVRPGVSISGAPTPARFPALARALEQGLLGVDAATALVDTLGPCERVAGRTAVGVAEGEIVAGALAPEADAAPALDADSVRLQATVWRTVLDPDGPAPSAADVERRGLVLGVPRHGLVPLRGLLLPDVAAGLSRYADAWTNPRTPPVPTPGGCTGEVDETDGTPAPGGCTGEVGETDEVTAMADRRSRAQVLHDVLANALVVAARAGDAPSVAGAPPTLVVTVAQQDLTTGRGVAWADGHPVDLAVAHQTGCAGVVEKVVLGPGGQITGLGSDHRCFTAQQRRAIAVRDRGCVIPGCHVPATWCEVHHVTPHATDPDGTHTDNGVLLCWHHHRTLDTSGWDIRIHHGLPQIRPPGWLDKTRTWRPTT